MTDAVDPVRPFERRQSRRRADDASRPAHADGETNLPVVIETAHAQNTARPPPAAGAPVLHAQVHGQTGQKPGPPWYKRRAAAGHWPATGRRSATSRCSATGRCSPAHATVDIGRRTAGNDEHTAEESHRANSHGAQHAAEFRD